MKYSSPTILGQAACLFLLLYLTSALDVFAFSFHSKLFSQFPLPNRDLLWFTQHVPTYMRILL
jgi:hypothetical protein